MAVTVTQLNAPANGITGGNFTVITQDNVLNVVDTVAFLTTPAGVANGTVQADYTVNPLSGALTVRDTVFTFATGEVIATYYGNEATNPVFLANPTFAPPNPGYAITQYIYSSPGVLAQVAAYDSTGKVFVGNGGIAT